MVRDKLKTRARLFAVAAEMLGEHGIGATTVDEIALRAGVAKGTVYYHFGSKEEFVKALIAEGLEPLSERMRDVAAAASTAREALAALVRAELTFICENRAFARLVVTEMWRENRVWRDTLMMIRERIVTVVKEQIERGIATGELRADLDPHFAARALFALTATAALDWLAVEPDRSLEEVEAQILRLTSIAATTHG